MNAKDRAEFEIDNQKIKIIRREQNHGPDRIDVNQYDYPEGRLRDYTQYNFRVDENATGESATYIGKEDQPEPSVTAVRALHEYGFECSNFSLPDLWESWDVQEAIEVILGITPILTEALENQNDPTAKHLTKVGGRYFQHLYGWLENADEEDYETLTAFLDKLAEEDVSAERQMNEKLDWDKELQVSERIIQTLISHEHDIDFDKDFHDAEGKHEWE